ncbi:hypothetical protein D3C78_1930390 [compost metagenome]
MHVTHITLRIRHRGARGGAGDGFNLRRLGGICEVQYAFAACQKIAAALALFADAQYHAVAQRPE